MTKRSIASIVLSIFITAFGCVVADAKYELSHEPPSVPVVDAAARSAKFVEIPIVGELGVDIFADGVEAALDAAAKRGVRHIVVRFAHVRGDMEIARNIAELIKNQPDDVSVLAIVEGQTVGAEKMILACDAIVMRSDAELAVFGSPIHLVQRDDGYKLVAAPQSEDVVHLSVNEPGAQLTITAADAHNTGLATLSDQPIADLHVVVGLRDWSRLGRIGELAVEAAKERRVRARIAEETKERRRIAAEERRAAELAKTLDDIDALLRYIEDGIAIAESMDPSRHRYSRRYGGGFTPESRRRWRQRTDEAIAAWQRVDDAIEKLIRAEKKARELGSAPNLHSFDIQTMASLVQSNLNRLFNERDWSGR